jgi:hypothetical protein
MRLPAVAAIVMAAAAAAPRVVSACATCISSGYGDRSFTWAYIGLILMPFAVGIPIVVTLAWYAGWRPQHVIDRIAAWTARRGPRPARAEISPRTHTETP